MNDRSRVAGLLLAAGASRRLGEPKQLLRTVDGEPLVCVMVQRLLDAGCSHVFVVLGANVEQVQLALAPVMDTEAMRGIVQCIEHAGWAEGMGTSIAAGVAALEAAPEAALETADIKHALQGALIAACDMPSVTSAHLRALIEASASTSFMRPSASVYGAPNGEQIVGIPAVFPSSDFAALRNLSGDRGARALLRETDIPLIALAGGDLDLDTPDDVRRWRTS
ncbi:MAG: nucleotidyltransferase family protein [Gemmatimonadaceae bacterium]|nr:nucleotidyltransferase family protein [Gemmatimonadaceae bacterium]